MLWWGFLSPRVNQAEELLQVDHPFWACLTYPETSVRLPLTYPASYPTDLLSDFHPIPCLFSIPLVPDSQMKGSTDHFHLL